MDTPFRPAAVFGDRMVLGQHRPIRVFGEASDGACVTVELNGALAEALAMDGRFETALPSMPAGGPYTMTFREGASVCTFSDVWIGEVYLAGGQSNMELELKDAADGARLIADTDEPMIRYFNVPKQPWLDATALEAERAARWKTLAPGACGDISAVAYHFAMRMHAALGVAVGIIDCYWGGTSAAAWIDEATLRQFAEGAELLDNYAAAIQDKTEEQYAREVEAHDRAVEAWARQVDAGLAKQPPTPWPEMIEQIGLCPWNPPKGRKSGFRPGGLADTMVRRVAPYPLTGFIYYQGEEDTRHPWKYRALMSALIAFWRELFQDQGLPFVFAQLPMFRNSYEADDLHWAELRDAQAWTWRETRHTGMAVLIDCGELDNIHPTDKATPGDRFFREMMRVAFDDDTLGECPRALAAWRQGKDMVVRLNTPVAAEPKPALFELAGADGAFVPAQARVTEWEIRISADSITLPQQVRYAWVNYGQVNVFGVDGLPLAPFWLTNGACLN